MDQPVNQDITEKPNPEAYISPLTILLFLTLLILFGMFLGSSAIYFIGKYFNLSLQETMDMLGSDNTIQKRNFIRTSLLANHLFLFVIPPFILSYIFFKKKWYKFLAWKKLSVDTFLVNFLVGTILLFVSMPLVQYLYYLNKQLPIPNWARTMDESTNEMIKNLLVTEAPWELFFNIFVIAVIPAIGEEMIFRGVIQRRFEKMLGNIHLAVWSAAIIFSLFHMQLEGFLPRLVLGALLGYLFYWSKSLWIPVLIHFLNNGLQIVAAYFFMDELSKLEFEKVNTVPIWAALISIFLLLGISRFLINFNRSKHRKKAVSIN